jgi:hypothetical protein
MRFKLVLLTSLIASIFGVGFSIAILAASFGILDFAQLQSSRDADSTLLALGLSVPPPVSAVLAGVFVYRHTAKRRKLQAGLAGILVLLLCVVEFTLLLFVMQLSD